MEINDETKPDDFRKLVRKKTITAFSVFFLCIIGVYGIYKWIITQPKDDKAYAPFRKVLNVNAKIFSQTYNNPTLTKEFSKEIATKKVRVNGKLGLKSPLDSSGWILKVVRYSELSPEPSDTLILTLAELKKLPKTDVVFNFRCIEGWSQISWWGGVRFSDFAKKYKIGTRDNSEPDTKQPDNIANYCGLVTPDKEYYVGIDMPSMMHPQTILCYELNGQPLTSDHGAPLRLIIPVKYGIKHIKRIGTIFFSDEQPPDYWGLRGYDYFAGL